MRTLPERSEFRGGSREAETREDRLRSGSIHRARFGSERGQPKRSINQHRKLSTASSPCSYRVWTPEEEEEEVDHYGYVLAGSPGIPERGESIVGCVGFIEPRDKYVISPFFPNPFLLSLQSFALGAQTREKKHLSSWGETVPRI